MLSKQDVITGVSKLVADKFGGDWQAGFNAYATAGTLSRSEVSEILDDAGVGSWLTRPAIAAAVVSEIGANGVITWEQFQTLTHVAPSSPPAA